MSKHSESLDRQNTSSSPSVDAKDILNRLIQQESLTYDEMTSLMQQIMSGQLSPVWISALIIGLRVKKETVDEIAAAAGVMRKLVTKVPVEQPDNLLDIVGTGGDGAHTFNISTAAMFVAAAAGAHVAKHGGRSVSSKSGSADVLEQLGVNINLSPEQIAQCINQAKIGFMFAPNHHSAMKYAAPVRKELGIRTLFNILGPLTNPAGASNQLLGVFHADLVAVQIRALQRLGCKRALCVFGEDGLDEISISGHTLIGELNAGHIQEYRISPEDFGLKRQPLEKLRVDGAQQSKEMLLAALSGQHEAACDIVALNAGAGLYTLGQADSIADGLAVAKSTIASGAALKKLDELASLSQSFS